MGGLGPFGLMAQDGLRESFKTIEQGLQFSILLRSGAKQGHHFGSEFHSMRQTNYRVDRGGGQGYRLLAAQAVGVSSATC